MKICRNCNQTYGDEAGFCGKCGGNLDIISEQQTEDNNQQGEMTQPDMTNQQMNMGAQQPMMNPQMGMVGQQPMMNSQMNMMGQQPMMNPQMNMGMSAPKPPKAKMSKKKKKAIIITLSVLLALAAIAFGVVLFLFRYPKVEDMKEDLLEERAIYSVDDMYFMSEDIDIKINKQENKDGECKSYCTVTFSDDIADRTVELVVVCEKDGLTEWDYVASYPDDEKPTIVLKEGYAEEVAEDYEVNNLTDFVDESDYESGELRYVYSVGDYRDLVNITGEIAFIGEIECNDNSGVEFEGDIEVDISDLEIDTAFDGTYRDISDEPTMGISLVEIDDNEYNLEIVSPIYGELSIAATLSEDGIFDENGNFCFCLYADADGYTFEIAFEENQIGSVAVMQDDYIVDAYIMEAGEFDIEMPEDESYITEGTLPDVDGETIYIYSWNQELGNRLDAFLEVYPEYAGRIEYVCLDMGGTSSEYNYEAENSVNTDMPASIIAYDYSVSDYFSNKDMYVSMESVGITDEMYANSYQYNIDYATYDGELMALTWQNSAGCFTYRSDIAIEVFGTDDPAVIQEKVADWDSFLETAETLKQHGYYIISSMDDITYDGYNFAELPSQEVVDAMEANGYSASTMRWSSDWTDDMSENVFGYFGCQWFVNWSLWCEEDISFRVCEGPMKFVWGNTYLGITHDCPDKEFAAFVLYSLCCDPNVMYLNATYEYEIPNNTVVMEQLIEEGQTLTPEGQIGDQNPLPIYHNVALQLEYQPN